MQLSASTLLKSKGRPAAGLPKLGDRVSFAGSVLRVMPGDDRPLLILIEANGQKIIVPSADLPGGAKLKGSSPLTMFGTVTRVGDSMVPELTPISMAVEGYAKTRITLGAKSVKRLMR